MSRTPVITGVGMTAFSANHTDASARDLATEAALACIADAGLSDIHAIQHGMASVESDHFNRQMTIGAVLHDHIGLVPTPNVRIEGGGATGALALRTAWAYIKSGLCDSILVYGVELNGRSVSSRTANQLFALSADADWDMMVGGTYTAFYAAMMRAHMQRFGTTEMQFAYVAARNRRNARFNPLAQKPMDITVEQVLASRMIAEPYRLLDCSLLSDGAAAVLLATKDWAQAHCSTFSERPTVAFTTTGCASDTMRLGDRWPDITHFRAKRIAAQQVYDVAGITHPLEEIDVAEVYDSYSGAELQAMESLGFVAEGEAGMAITSGVFDLGGTLPVNPSGGLLGRGAPVGATGIAQAIEICLQLWGRADPRRQVPDARRGLTDTHAGVGTICVVNLFERMG